MGRFPPCKPHIFRLDGLIEVVNKLEGIIFNLDASKSRGEVEALVAEFFKVFRSVVEVAPEGWNEVVKFPSLFDEEGLLKHLNAFFVDWDSRVNSYVVRFDWGRAVEFVRDALQTIVWGLVGKALKYLPRGNEALAQAYEDLLNGFGSPSDTDILEILYKVGLERAAAYMNYMSVKEKHRGEIRDFEKLLGFRQVLPQLEKKGLNYPTRVLVNSWWSKIYMFSQLDTDILDSFDSLTTQLLSLQVLIRLEKIYKKNGPMEVKRLLCPSSSMLKGTMLVEALVMSKNLSETLGEAVFRRVKSAPAIVPCLRRRLESCITENLKTLEAYTREKMESCLKTEENQSTRLSVSNPPYIVIYHTFFSPITWRGKRENPGRHPGEREVEKTVEEMEREIENFQPDRFRDFPLWWAKEKYMEKISKLDEDKRKKLVKLFYKLVKGSLEIQEYHSRLNSL
jgi:hypothetical protein